MDATGESREVPLAFLAALGVLVAIAFLVLGFVTVGTRSILAADDPASGSPEPERSGDPTTTPAELDAGATPAGRSTERASGTASPDDGIAGTDRSDQHAEAPPVGLGDTVVEGGAAVVSPPGIAPAGPRTSIDGGVGGDDAGAATGDLPSEAEPRVLRFVYFVEADREVDHGDIDAIEQQAVALQALWYDQFGGTFLLPAEVDVVYGDHPSAWYTRNPNGDDERWFRLANLGREVERDLDISLDDPDVRVVVYPATRIDGLVGANRYEGAWMDGDDIGCIDGGFPTTPYTPDFPAGCLTTIAHELGHVYGLGHEGPEADCMQYGFYRYMSPTDDCVFSAENRARVIGDPRNAGWLAARPGDRVQPAGA